ncbi:MAG: hypothetical protein A3J35_06225 [Gammaproteobacteria bacterium RIFCSPLOWO2_02_FULL_52_10]|nr:MAG: hypothetical protein A3J35_06225 [Gammaproteobacteria bacterium RIFCSPLOWO2_02_FULL_52_10]
MLLELLRLNYSVQNTDVAGHPESDEISAALLDIDKSVIRVFQNIKQAVVGIRGNRYPTVIMFNLND